MGPGHAQRGDSREPIVLPHTAVGDPLLGPSPEARIRDISPNRMQLFHPAGAAFSPRWAADVISTIVQEYPADR